MSPSHLSLLDLKPLRALVYRSRQELLHRLAVQVVQPVQRVEGIYLLFALCRRRRGHQRKPPVRGAAPEQANRGYISQLNLMAIVYFSVVPYRTVPHRMAWCQGRQDGRRARGQEGGPGVKSKARASRKHIKLEKYASSCHRPAYRAGAEGKGGSKVSDRSSEAPYFLVNLQRQPN